MTRLIIFDYGRTLYNPDTRNLFNDAVEVVGKLAQNYKLAIVSVSAKEDEINRINLLKAHGILHHFKSILFTYDPEQKSDLYEQTLTKCNISPADVAIIDDYVIRGISWGNRVGSTTVWFCNGRFSDVEPDAHTGKPTYIIYALNDLLKIFQM